MITEANEIIEEDWIVVKSIIKSRAVKEAAQEACTKYVKNRCIALVTEDDDIEEEENHIYKKALARSETK